MDLRTYIFGENDQFLRKDPLKELLRGLLKAK